MHQICLICLVILACILTCCKTSDTDCSDAQQYFLSRVDEVDLSQFYGLAITMRGITPDGSRRLRAIEFRPENEEWIVITGYEFAIKESSPETYSKIVKFAKYFGQKEDDAVSFYLKYCRNMTKYVNKLKVEEITSNLALGDFIIFRFSDDCALVYKEANANIKYSKWKAFFNDKNKISERWYVMN